MSFVQVGSLVPWLALARRRLATLADLQAQPPRPFRAPLRAGTGAVIVHRSTVPGPEWQATLFLGGEPVSHKLGEWRVAVQHAHDYGADLALADHQDELER